MFYNKWYFLFFILLSLQCSATCNGNIPDEVKKGYASDMQNAFVLEGVYKVIERIFWVFSRSFAWSFGVYGPLAYGRLKAKQNLIENTSKSALSLTL